MLEAKLEHVNLTVTDPLKSAKTFSDIFGWHIRWQGEAKDGGMTCLLYTSPSPRDATLSRMPSSA